MAKSSSLLLKRNSSTGRFIEVQSGNVMGVTKDGVKILAPKIPPKKFSQKDIWDAVSAVKK